MATMAALALAIPIAFLSYGVLSGSLDTRATVIILLISNVASYALGSLVEIESTIKKARAIMERECVLVDHAEALSLRYERLHAHHLAMTGEDYQEGKVGVMEPESSPQTESD
jgi:hypothetical protein